MLDPGDPDAYTVGWVCALSTEFTAAQEQFDEEYEPHESPEHRDANDFNVYSFGKIKGHMVVVAVLPNGQYGTASAATVAKDMIRSFRNIRFGLMVGIGGGAPTKQHDIRLGDVVVSSPSPGQSGVFQYDFGKATKDVFQHTASHNKPPPLLLAAVAGLKTQYERKGLQIHDKVSTIVANNKRLSAKYGRPEDPDSLFSHSIGHNSDPCHEFCVTAPTDLIDRTPRQEPMEVVEVHYGTIASGNTLMKDPFKRDELASKANILCFEMEAAGLMDGFRCLVIRGICDYSDSHKNDSWQGYAAMTAAVYAKQILSRIRPEAVAREETIISKIDEVFNSVISGVENLKRSIAEQEVLNWLSDEDFGTYQFDERSKKAPGTCQWFLDSPEYQSWTQEKGQVLFCPGIAGAGKTVLASAIIESLHSRFQSDSSTAIVHIYCRYNRVDRQTFNKLRVSLLRQLCERLSPLPEGIMQLYSQYKPRRVEAPPERILSELESVSGLFSKVFMVVDALDEWRATEHADLYSLPGELLHLQRKLAMNLLATSRPIPLIANQFNDIYAYVDNFRWPESSCIGKIAGLRGLVKKVLSHNSRLDVKDALKRFEDRAKNNDNDPKFNILDQAYNDTLKRLREQHQNSSDLAFRLPAGAIQHGLALREGDTTFHEDGIVDESLLLSVCCGLIEIPEGSREIRLHNRHLLDEYFLARHSINCHLPSNADAYLARQHLPGGIGNDPQLQLRHYSYDMLIHSMVERLYDRRCGSSGENYEALADKIQDPLYTYSAFNWGGHTSIDFLQTRGMVDQAIMLILTLGTWSEDRQAPQDMSNLHLAALFGLGDLAGDSCGRTALVWALECLAFEFKFNPDYIMSVTKNFEIYDGIDIARANPRMPGYNGDTPLHLAAILGDVEISNQNVNLPLVEALLERGTVDMFGENRRTALIEAASVGNLAPIETLVREGALVDFPDRTGKTALMKASKLGHTRVVELLLKSHSDVDHQDYKRDTAIMNACKANAQLGIKNSAGETALADAGRHCGKGIIKRLLQHITDPVTRDQQSDIVSLILEDAELKPTSKYIDLALSKSLLIDHGANPNMTSKSEGLSLLGQAIHFGNDAVVLTLLDAGINIEGDDRDESRPIHAAAARGTKTVVQSLIERGVSVNRRSAAGLFPLDYAMRRQDNDTSIANLLRKHGAITEGKRLVQLMQERSKRLN
ncbi:hypothetical protein BKA60DRAFT_611430 [Fusarium oxysporum]|nr:hypothetical protein BKA60DRAFT_611430 [Fusarium oxysporum]